MSMSCCRWMKDACAHPIELRKPDMAQRRDNGTSGTRSATVFDRVQDVYRQEQAAYNVGKVLNVRCKRDDGLRDWMW
jgi:hypothetical protein